MHHGPNGRQTRDIGIPKRARYSLERFFQAVEAITRLAAEAPTVEEGLRRTLALFCEALEWPLGHVYQLVDAQDQVFSSAALWHSDGSTQFAPFREATQRVSFLAGQGLIGQVLAEGRPALSSDVSRDRSFVRRRSAAAADIHGWCAFPVIAGGRVVAVCEFCTTERTELDPTLLILLSAAGLALGRLYEREHWRAEVEALQRKLAERDHPVLDAERESLSALAAAVTHEVNSPLFAARASLALLDAEEAGRPFVEGARAELARIAAVMETLASLAQEAPIGQRLTRIVGQTSQVQE